MAKAKRPKDINQLSKSIVDSATREDSVVPSEADLKDMAVEFDMDSTILTIHSPTIQVFHLQNKPVSYSDVDSVITTVFAGIAKNGKKCNVIITFYKSQSAQHFVCFKIEYYDETYMYYADIG